MIISETEEDEENKYIFETYNKLQETRKEVLTAIEKGLEDENEPVLVFSHISHVYTNGGSLYITYLYRRAQDPYQTLERWKKIKGAASQAIVAHGGTITHQHGIGIDHKDYLPAEKGALGMAMIESLVKNVDPKQIMNRGKLIDGD